MTDACGLNTLGYTPDQVASLKRLVRTPLGLSLIAGPTASGMSMTLTRSLRDADAPRTGAYEH